MNPDPPRPVTLFMGEVVRRHHPALVAVVFVFALFLAAVPFLFRYERSPLPEALSLYDRVCQALAAGDLTGIQSSLSLRSGAHRAVEAAFLASKLHCVDRRTARVSLEPVRDPTVRRAYLLTLVPKDGSPTIRFRVMEDEGALRWWPGPRDLEP